MGTLLVAKPCKYRRLLHIAFACLFCSGLTSRVFPDVALHELLRSLTCPGPGLCLRCFSEDTYPALLSCIYSSRGNCLSSYFPVCRLSAVYGSTFLLRFSATHIILSPPSQASSAEGGTTLVPSEASQSSSPDARAASEPSTSPSNTSQPPGSFQTSVGTSPETADSDVTSADSKAVFRGVILESKQMITSKLLILGPSYASRFGGLSSSIRYEFFRKTCSSIQPTQPFFDQNLPLPHLFRHTPYFRI